MRSCRGLVPQACLCAALLYTLAFGCHLVGMNTPQQHSAPDDHGQACSSHPLFSLNDFNQITCLFLELQANHLASWQTAFLVLVSPPPSTEEARVVFSALFSQNVPCGERRRGGCALILFYFIFRAPELAGKSYLRTRVAGIEQWLWWGCFPAARAVCL